jgi:3-deoxy-manno-octulosonate cytidylyltransferase (CMP-KDO synthetase)
MIIIPARLMSNRFAKKVLVDIHGLPMVIKTAKQVEELDEVVIATDSNEVVQLADKYGIRSVMTSLSCQSGTDRICEAGEKLGLSDEQIVINVQADEPFIEKEVIEKIIELTKKNKDSDEILINSCHKDINLNSVHDVNLVKVVLNKYDEAIYFSRSVIPFNRDDNNIDYYGHLGIYGFSMKNLRKFCAYKPSPLENIEKLEQLRAIYNGYKIAMVKVQTRSFGIDTQEDLERAFKIFESGNI